MRTHANITVKTTPHSYANARTTVSIASRESYSDTFLEASTAVTTLVVKC
jgi:hypothetical protein